MICEALCDLAPARLSHFMSHRSPLSCSKLSTLRRTHPPTLHHLVMIYLHWLFCFSDTGPPCADRRVAQCVISGGHSVGCRGDDAPGNVQPGSPAHTHQLPHCKAVVPADPATCMSTCGFSACLALSCHPLNKYFTKHYAIPGRTDYLICRAPSKMKIRPSYSKMVKNFKMVTTEY